MISKNSKERRKKLHSDMQLFHFCAISKLMDSSKPENYHVATKAFVRNGEEILICHDAHNDTWDLPGGRIGRGEFGIPLEKILDREIIEELGVSFWRNSTFRRTC